MKELTALIIELPTPAVAASGEANSGEANTPTARAAAMSESLAPAAVGLEEAGEVYHRSRRCR